MVIYGCGCFPDKDRLSVTQFNIFFKQFAEKLFTATLLVATKSCWNITQSDKGAGM